MAEPFVLIGSVDQTKQFVLQDLTGAGKTGLVAADLTCYYNRRRAAAVAVALADLAAVDSAHSDGGLKEIDATNMPGHYRLDLPDAAFAAGSEFVAVAVKGATIMPSSKIIPLWQFNDTNMDLMRKELLNDRIHDPETGTHEVLDDDGVTVHETLTPYSTIAITAANWTNATLDIVKAGAFTNYRWKSGDLVTLTAGTGVSLGQYEIASKQDANTIRLTADINGTGVDIADNSVAGSIVTGRLFIART
jgi:hypothetical protein